MTEIVGASAARTPVGNLNGVFAGLPASKLGEVVIRAVLDRANLHKKEVSEVILGQILTAGAGQNPARQAALSACLPVEVPAYSLNQLCGSGLKSVAMGYQAIYGGDSTIVVAGGQESMSQAPHCIQIRGGKKMGHTQLMDTMVQDGLLDAFNGYHMGCTAENIAEKWQISREEQDEFAVRSQHLAEAAQTVVPGSTLSFTGEHGSDARTYKVGIKRILTELKDYFKPEWDLFRGGRELIELFQRVCLTEEQFRGPSCIRLVKLNQMIQSKVLDKNLTRI